MQIMQIMQITFSEIHSNQSLLFNPTLKGRQKITRTSSFCILNLQKEFALNFFLNFDFNLSDKFVVVFMNDSLSKTDFLKILVFRSNTYKILIILPSLVVVPVDTGSKLNVHKTFRKRPGRLLKILCTFNLRPVSTGCYSVW